MAETEMEIPIGLCQCRCGKPTKPAPQTYRKRGWVKGQPIRFVQHHSGRVKSAVTLQRIGENRRRYSEIVVDGDIARVRLTKQKWTVIDAADVVIVKPFKWGASVDGRGRWEARTRVALATWQGIKMHRLIAVAHGLLESLDDPREIDHRDRDSLNNRRQNLRPANRSQNVVNSAGQSQKRKSLYKGVWWALDERRGTGRWRAGLGVNGKRVNRTCVSELAAACAYNTMALEHFGEFAWLNDTGCTYPCAVHGSP